MAAVASRTGPLGIAIRGLFDNIGRLTTYAATFIHLSRHLETPPLLTADQIARYNDLRGYGAADPCATVPEGHDPTMWRRHNNCGN